MVRYLLFMAVASGVTLAPDALASIHLISEIDISGVIPSPMMSGSKLRVMVPDGAEVSPATIMQGDRYRMADASIS